MNVVNILHWVKTFTVGRILLYDPHKWACLLLKWLRHGWSARESADCGEKTTVRWQQRYWERVNQSVTSQQENTTYILTQSKHKQNSIQNNWDTKIKTTIYKQCSDILVWILLYRAAVCDPSKSVRWSGSGSRSRKVNGALSQYCLLAKAA